MLIEIIVTNREEAILAEKYGADRLELIHDFNLGGLSPPLEISQDVCAAVQIPVSVMVRPHGKNFVYDQQDRQQIIREINYLRDHTSAHGIVFGALTEEDTLNIKLLKHVIASKERLALTFHRAIDTAYDTFTCYQELLNYKEIDVVLTSGGKPTALEGTSVIKQMVELGNPYSHAKILAGSGINPDNAQEIIKQTSVKQIHLGSGVRTNNALDPNKFTQLLHLRG